MEQSTKFIVICVTTIIIFIIGFICLILSFNGYIQVQKDSDPVLSSNVLTSILSANGVSMGLCFLGIILLIWQSDNILKYKHELDVENKIKVQSENAQIKDSLEM